MNTTKIEVSYRIEAEHRDWLEAMAKENALPDASKALRVLIDYAMEDGDRDEIFRTIRCRRC